MCSPVNPVLRSASFHGTRQLVASSSEEDEEIVLSAEDEDWPGLPAPQVSRTDEAEFINHNNGLQAIVVPRLQD